MSEISPPAYRATFPGVAYQIGNMVSAASAQIETTGGDNHKIANPRYSGPGQPNPTKQPAMIADYAFVSAVLLGVVCAYILIVILFGQEFRGAAFEKAPLATEQDAGKLAPDDIEKVGEHRPSPPRVESDNGSSNKEDYEDVKK